VENGATVLLVTHAIDEAVLSAGRALVPSSRPGRTRAVAGTDIPRPRRLGRDAHLAEVARCSAELHERLMEREEPAMVGVSGS
jgi:NitT/TauT family transport system ATP-binding protein